MGPDYLQRMGGLATISIGDVALFFPMLDLLLVAVVELLDPRQFDLELLALDGAGDEPTETGLGVRGSCT